MATKITYGDCTTIQFKETKIGEIFKHKDYLFICTEDEFLYDYGTMNAICLNDGSFEYFEANDEVQKVDVEIKVKFI